MQTNGRLQLYPLLRVAVAMAAGIFVGYEWGRSLGMWPWLTATAAATLGALFSGRKPLWQGAFILTASFFLGGVLLVREMEKGGGVMEAPASRDGEVMTAVVMSEPVERGKVVRFDLRIVGGDHDGVMVKGSLLKDTMEQRYRQLHLGDGIMAEMRLEPPKRFGDSRFNYPLYLRCRGFTATAFLLPDDWMEVQVDLSGWSHLDRTRLAALLYRQRMLQRYTQLGIGDEEGAVAVAMTLGDRTRITNELRDVYSISGASHVLALSGMHLGIIYLLLSAVLGIGRWRVFRETLVIAGIWSYVFLTGMSPSVVRAAVMITVYSVVSIVGRNRMSLNALAFTAIVMLVANPLLLYDVGFEMSMLAVLFILLLYPRAQRLVSAEYLQEHRVVRWAWQLALLSCCAQLGTAPLTAYYFGRFSTYFLLTNFVVIPLATVLLYLSVLLMAATVWPAMAGWIAKGLALVAGWQNTVVAWISALPGSHVDGIALNRLQVLLIYVCMAALFVFLRVRYRRFR